LREGHDAAQIGTAQSAHARIPLVPFDDASKGLPGDELHHLCEQRLAHVHASPRGRSSPRAWQGQVAKTRSQLPGAPPSQPLTQLDRSRSLALQELLKLSGTPPPEIQIVYPPESPEMTANAGVTGGRQQIDRTLVPCLEEWLQSRAAPITEPETDRG